MRLKAIYPIVFIAVFGLFASSVWAQDGGAVPKSDSYAVPIPTRSVAGASAPQLATSTTNTPGSPLPSATLPPPATSAPAPTPAFESTSTPVVMPVAVPTNNQPVLFVADPIDIPQPENSRGIVSIFLAVMGLVALGGYGVYKLKMGGGGQSKNTEKEKKDELRCLNLKKLMEEKLRELTDVRGQMESKLKEKAREEIREALAGTPAAKALALVERAEKEYARLEQLYNTCMIEFQTKKRVFLVHGWDGAPEDAWFPWLKRELEAKGFHVEAPAMPNPEWPKIEAWVSHLARVVGEVDEHTFFVGHSIGCQAIMRYIESLPKDKKVGGAVFVAGFFTLMNLENDEAKEIARPWLEIPIDCQKVKAHTEKFFALFSDNDADVPLSNKELFVQRLGAETFVEHDKGHFSDSDGVKELPIVLGKLLVISSG